ncbi:hypothetical protein [Mycoplasma todarodis]|uniref:Uncharacterized protein n=1 Tax=Mycoplasma todarodis TaxID=1937191 RepID=A0A4R0XU56_9MOLU|nr:hypothetical protein [Mycoplasma todarodis]TCG12068.1 hypothetical protein C4B25_00035 [Mycoplasma todarodis]
MKKIEQLQMILNTIHMKKMKIHSELMKYKKFLEGVENIHNFLRYKVHESVKSSLLNKGFAYSNDNKRGNNIVVILNEKNEKDRTWNYSIYEKFVSEYGKQWSVISFGDNAKLEKYCKENGIKINKFNDDSISSELFAEESLIDIEILTNSIINLIYKEKIGKIKFLFGSTATGVKNISVFPMFKSKEEYQEAKKYKKRFGKVRFERSWQKSMASLFKLYISMELKTFLLESKIVECKLAIFRYTKKIDEIKEEIANEKIKISSNKREKEFQEMSLIYEK